MLALGRETSLLWSVRDLVDRECCGGSWSWPGWEGRGGLGVRDTRSGRSNLGGDSPFALQLALIALECLLPAVLKVATLMVFRQTMLNISSETERKGNRKRGRHTEPQNCERQRAHSPMMRKAAEEHWESVPRWNWQRFLAGITDSGGGRGQQRGGERERGQGVEKGQRVDKAL